MPAVLPRRLARSMRSPIGRLLVGSTLVTGVVAGVASAPAAAQTSTHLQVARSAATVASRAPVTLSARLTDGAGHPLANRPVRLVYRYSGNWLYLKDLRSNSNGVVALVARPYRSFQFTAHFGGNAIEAPSWAKPAAVTVRSSLGQRALALAKRYYGSPYQYGGVGPHRFDCSGFTRFVFSHFGRALAHNAASQYGEVRHISRSAVRPGDLVFFTGSGGIYHVGLYAGGGRILAATHSGDVVRNESLAYVSWVAGRVR